MTSDDQPAPRRRRDRNEGARASRPRPRPTRCALTIAGLDPSGGAGLSADLRGFDTAGVWGCAACAALTVQSTAGLISVLPTPSEQLRAQIDEVLAHQRIRALKTGALGSTANVRTVIDVVRQHPALPLVVDPVMIATRAPGGARLLDDDALAAMRELCSLATVVTPNRDEAEALLGVEIRGAADQQAAARALVALGATAALVKGGHLDGPVAADALAIGDRVVMLEAPRRQRAEFHGGGCLLAALLAGHLARSPAPRSPDAIERAARASKQALTRAVLRSRDIGDGLLVPSPG